MSKPLRYFLYSASASFVLLGVLAFTPLAAIPSLFNLVTTGWDGLLFTLVVIGAPFGGFVFLLIFTRPSELLHEIAGLAGLWLGAVSGSWIGLRLAGVL